MPGAIDDQVHLSRTLPKNIESESERLPVESLLLSSSLIQFKCGDPRNFRRKYQVAAERSYANYSFMMGATNDNLEEF
jgi:dihydroorotase